MFLPLASTMSVFNCRAVGVRAEKTCTRSRQVRGRTEGGLGRGKQLDCSQQSEFLYEVSPFRAYRMTLSLFFFFCLFSSLLWRGRLRPGIQRHFSCVKFDQLTERLSGSPSLLVQSDEISSSNHFFFSSAPSPLSLTALLRVGLTAPDLVQLQRSSGRQPCLLNSFYFPLLLLLCFSSPFSLSPTVDLPFSLQHLFFFSPPPSFGAESSAGCCSRGCCAALFIHSFCWLQRLNGRAQRR